MRMMIPALVAVWLGGCATPQFKLLDEPRTVGQKFESCNLDEVGPARKKCTTLPVIVEAKVDAVGTVRCEARLDYDVALIYYKAKPGSDQGRITWALKIDAPPGLKGRFEFTEEDGILFKKGRSGTYADPRRSANGREFSLQLVSTAAAALDHVAVVQYVERDARPIDCARQDPVIINLPGQHN